MLKCNLLIIRTNNDFIYFLTWINLQKILLKLVALYKWTIKTIKKLKIFIDIKKWVLLSNYVIPFWIWQRVANLFNLNACKSEFDTLLFQSQIISKRNEPILSIWMQILRETIFLIFNSVIRKCLDMFGTI